MRRFLYDIGNLKNDRYNIRKYCEKFNITLTDELILAF